MGRLTPRANCRVANASLPRELKTIIAAQGDLARNLTEKLLAYALCRQLEGYDEIVVDRLMESFRAKSTVCSLSSPKSSPVIPS